MKIGQKELKKGDGGRGKGERERRREMKEQKRGKRNKVWGTSITEFCLYIYSTASICTQTGHTQPHTFPGLQGGGRGLPSGPPLWTA